MNHIYRFAQGNLISNKVRSGVIIPLLCNKSYSEKVNTAVFHILTCDANIKRVAFYVKSINKGLVLHESFKLSASEILSEVLIDLCRFNFFKQPRKQPRSQGL